MATKHKMPRFKSEQEEAAWWDAHPEVITELFLKARKEGRIKRLPVVRGATRPVTIRMPIADVEVAQEIAERQGVPYQTYIKGLLHKALERERKARLSGPAGSVGNSTITAFNVTWTAEVREQIRFRSRKTSMSAHRWLVLLGLVARRVSIALRHSQVEFTEFCSLGVC
jgi:predicted DNA binding CopG/RHH family protein